MPLRSLPETRHSVKFMWSRDDTLSSVPIRTVRISCGHFLPFAVLVSARYKRRLCFTVWMLTCSIDPRGAHSAAFLRICDDDDVWAGCALCAAAVAQDAGIYDHGAADAGAGHRGECRDLYAGEFGAAEESAGRRPKDADSAGRTMATIAACGFNDTRDDGSYSNFSTDTYEQLKKNVPEFEELAAMQAGFTYRPIIARRDGTADRGAIGDGRVCVWELLSDIWASACGGTIADGFGRCAGRRANSGDEL